MTLRISVLLLGAMLLCLAGGAQADCIVGNTTLAFGAYNPASGATTTANATITITCSAIISASTSVPFTLLLSAGGGTVTNRQMTGATRNLPYNIYTTGAYTTVWDNTTGVSGSVTITGLLGLPILTLGQGTQTAFGRILGSQPVPAGAYTDSLTMTVSF
jgi:spore coat protein U-like protein